MESALANVDLGRYRRIVQMIWDPEPSNNTSLDLPVWCLGQSYSLSDDSHQTPDARTGCDAELPATPTTTSLTPPPSNQIKETSALPENTPETPQESAWGSFSSSLAYDESTQEGAWPSGFLDDFGSRLWMTYRSDFDTIPRSSDPKAASMMSLSMRIRTQLGDQTGLSSDSGWGCMIRSGQSLLANTISILRLGRGMVALKSNEAMRLVETLTKNIDWRRGKLPHSERQIISMFADDPNAKYSIHNFVRHGATACGKYPGEWFGPSATAQCIQYVVYSLPCTKT